MKSEKPKTLGEMLNLSTGNIDEIMFSRMINVGIQAMIDKVGGRPLDGSPSQDLIVALVLVNRLQSEHLTESIRERDSLTSKYDQLVDRHASEIAIERQRASENLTPVLAENERLKALLAAAKRDLQRIHGAVVPPATQLEIAMAETSAPATTAPVTSSTTKSEDAPRQDGSSMPLRDLGPVIPRASKATVGSG